MRDDAHVMRLGKSGDLLGVGQPPDEAHVGAHEAAAARREELVELPDPVQAFASRDRDGDRPLEVAHPLHAVRHDRILEEERPEPCKLVRQAGCVVRVEAPVHLDAEVHLVSDCVAHGRDPVKHRLDQGGVPHLWGSWTERA